MVAEKPTILSHMVRNSFQKSESIRLSCYPVLVADTPDGFDSVVPSWIGPEFSTQIAHVHVYTAIMGNRLPAEGRHVEVTLCHHLTAVLKESKKNTEFSTGQFDRLAGLSGSC